MKTFINIIFTISSFVANLFIGLGMSGHIYWLAFIIIALITLIVCGVIFIIQAIF